MQNVLTDGGFFTWIAMAATVVLYLAIFREILLKRSKYAPALYSSVAALLCLGLAGTAMGLMAAVGVGLEKLPALLSIASIPMAFASTAAAPALVFIGLTSSMARDGKG